LRVRWLVHDGFVASTELLIDVAEVLLQALTRSHVLVQVGMRDLLGTPAEDSWLLLAVGRLRLLWLLVILLVVVVDWLYHFLVF